MIGAPLALGYTHPAVRVADLYLARRVAAPLLAIILVVGVVVSLWQLGRVSSMVLLNLSDVGLLLSIIVDLAPTFASIALGVSGIFGCLLAYDRLAEDGELAAMSAAGIPPWRIFLPALVTSLVLFVGAAAAGIWGEPWGTAHYNRDVAVLATRSFSRTLQAGRFTTVGDLASIYVNNIRVDGNGNAVWENMVLGRDMPTGPLIMTAKRAHVTVAGLGLLYLETEQGEALLPSKGEDVARLSYESASVTVDVAAWVRSAAMSLYQFQEWDIARMWAEVSQPDRSKVSGKAVSHFWQKIFLPFAMPLLALFGAIVGAQRGAQARARAYLMAALAVAVCFGLVGLGRNLIINGTLPGVVGANLQNVAGVAALWWLWRTRLRLAG